MTRPRARLRGRKGGYCFTESPKLLLLCSTKSLKLLHQIIKIANAHVGLGLSNTELSSILARSSEPPGRRGSASPFKLSQLGLRAPVC